MNEIKIDEFFCLVALLLSASQCCRRGSAAPRLIATFSQVIARRASQVTVHASIGVLHARRSQLSLVSLLFTRTVLQLLSGRVCE